MSVYPGRRGACLYIQEEDEHVYISRKKTSMSVYPERRGACLYIQEEDEHVCCIVRTFQWDQRGGCMEDLAIYRPYAVAIELLWRPVPDSAVDGR
jgi:hypothetical protein